MNLRPSGISLDRARDAFRTQLWPAPAFALVLAIVLGVGLPRLDARIDASLPTYMNLYLFGGGASAARSVLVAIAGSLITVTSLTFSLTVVTLQLASSQFSPRLLRTFTRDRFVHVTLAMFLGTFTYALTVLRTIRDTTDSQDLFVPQISVTFAYLLTLASVLALVLFLAHLAREIRVETMLQTVHTDASRAAQVALNDRDPRDTTLQVPDVPADADIVLARTSGFLVSVDEPAVLRAATEADAMVLLDRLPGASIVAGTPLGAAWSRPGSDRSSRLGELTADVAGAVVAGFERTETQDIDYGLRQLTDVATKALSPGINDPTTAVHALGHSSALLCELSHHDLGPVILRDEHGHVRVVLRRPTFADLLETAVAQPRQYGMADPLVLHRLFTLLRELAWVAGRPEQHTAITLQLSRLRATVQAQDFSRMEMATLDQVADAVDEALGHHWSFGSS